MLREAGTDRFTVPKMLVELDPEQVDNFTRIYQHHAAAMHRHVDHVRFLEDFLEQRNWSDALEEELIVQLPWPDGKLEALTAAMGPEVHAAGPHQRAQDLETARAIYSTTPFPETRSLAALVRLLLDDWEVQSEVYGIFASSVPAMQAEAALALTGWRVIYGPGIPDHYRELMEALRSSPFRLPAAVRLALLGDKDCPLPPEAIASEDADVRFMAALVTPHLDTLIATLQRDDELQRFAAATRLIEAGAFAAVGDTIRAAPPDQQLRLLKRIADQAKPAPALREAIFEIAAATSERDVRRAAVRVLCLGCPQSEVERLADAAQGDSVSYQSILQRAGLTAESLERLGIYFLEHGVFRADQYGMRDIARQGRMPTDFVPRNWANADEKGRIELCRFAEMQLEEYADERLHCFLVGVAFGSDSVPVRVTTWTSIYRWYRRFDDSGQGPLLIETESLNRFFGSVEAFVFVFTRFLQDRSLAELLGQMSLYDRVARLIRYSGDDVVQALATQPKTALELAAALAGVAQNGAVDFLLRIECVTFLGRLGVQGEFREQMRTAIAGFAGTDLDYASKQALERLTKG